MRRPLQLGALSALLTALLAAAVEDEARSGPEDRCLGQKNITCSCSPQHPEINVVSTHPVLKGAKAITIENCAAVNLQSELESGLEKLSVHNVSYLALESALPHSLTEFVLSRVGELAPLHPYVFQVPRNMNVLSIQDVTFKGLEPDVLGRVTTNFTEITGCRFPNLSDDSLYIDSHQVVVKGNNFSSLDAGALTVRSEYADVSDNSFEALVNSSIRWLRGRRQGLKLKLSFERNTIHSMEVGALAGLYSSENSTMAVNVLLCHAGQYKRCKELAAFGGMPVCDAEDVCRYREASAQIRELAEARGCQAASPQSDEECAVLVAVVSGLGRLQAASSVVTAAALLAVTLFAA